MIGLSDNLIFKEEPNDEKLDTLKQQFDIVNNLKKFYIEIQNKTGIHLNEPIDSVLFKRKRNKLKIDNLNKNEMIKLYGEDFINYITSLDFDYLTNLSFSNELHNKFLIDKKKMFKIIWKMCKSNNYNACKKLEEIYNVSVCYKYIDKSRELDFFEDNSCLVLLNKNNVLFNDKIQPNIKLNVDMNNADNDNSFYFNGNDYIDISISFNEDKKANFTISFWVETDTIYKYTYFLKLSLNNNEFNFNSEIKIYKNLLFAYKSTVMYRSPFYFKEKTYEFICLSFNEEEISLYLNDNKVYNKSYAIPGLYDKIFIRLGYLLTGKMKQIRVFDKYLTDEEVNMIYKESLKKANCYKTIE